MSDDNEYEVGYGRPPKNTQFRKGRSGNPNGRPRKDPSTCETFRRIASQKVRVNGQNGPKYITKWEAAITQIINKAASGDLKAGQMMMKLAAQFPDLVTQPVPGPNFIIEFVKSEREKSFEGELKPGETYEEWQQRTKKKTEE